MQEHETWFISLTAAERKAMPYKLFLTTHYWWEVQQEAFKRDRHQCVTCKVGQNLEVHHKTYDHRGDELNHLDDVVTLCDKCHSLAHGIDKPARPLKGLLPLSVHLEREMVRLQFLNGGIEL